jgi:putative transposase
LSIECRQGYIDKKHPTLSVRKQSELLGINRSGIYYQCRNPDKDVLLMNVIRDIWLAYPFYGYRKITIILRRDYKKEINKKRVLRLMQEAGIQAIYPKPKLSMGNKAHKVYPYLLKGMRITKPNQVWMVDITYLKLHGRFVYLVALIDVYSRYIVGWNLSFDLDTANCLNALEMALKQGKADIVNSDQGTQFTSGDWIDALNDYGIQISMDGKGRCIDNIYIERFWRTIKYEAIFLNDYEDYKALYDGVKNYIKFYLEERPHQALNYRTPKELYFEVKKEKILA